MTLGQQISYHDRLPAQKSPLSHHYSDTHCSNCRPYHSGADFTQYHSTTYSHQPDFPPSRVLNFVSLPTCGSECTIANRLSVLAELGQSRTGSRWPSDFMTTAAAGARRRCRRAGKHQGIKTSTANDQEGDRTKSIGGLRERIEAMRLDDGWLCRTEKPDAANHGQGSPKIIVEPARESNTSNWAEQFRQNETLYMRTTTTTTAAEQKIPHDEVQPCMVPTSSASVDAPHVRECESRFAQPYLFTCRDSFGRYPSRPNVGGAAYVKVKSQHLDLATLLPSHAQKAAVTAACWALKLKGMKPTLASPFKIPNARREGMGVFPPFIQATSPPRCTGAPKSPPATVAVPIIFAMDSTHPTFAGEAQEYHTIVAQDEQPSSMKTVIPLSGLGQTPRPGTFPSSIIVDGEVVVFEPEKTGLHLHSDPPFICPWQRFPLPATGGRCTRSQSPLCVMANHYNNAAGICHPLGSVRAEGHGTLCWCIECLKSQIAIYGVERPPLTPVQVSQATNSPSNLGSGAIDAASTREIHGSETLDTNDLNTGTTVTEPIITDADTNTSAVTIANATATIMAVLPAPSSSFKYLSFSAMYDSLEPANGCPTIPRPISPVTSPTLATSLSNPSISPYPRVTQFLPELLSTPSDDGNENSDEIPQAQVQDENSEYSGISPISLPSSWDVVSPVSTESYPTESLDFISGDDDDDEAYGGSMDSSS